MAPTRHQRVAVTSDQSLVAEAISAALRDRGFGTLVLRWPPALRGGGGDRGRARSTAAENVDVALMVSDLNRPERMRGALQVLGRVSAPWVVLTGSQRSPFWGALLENGAHVVAPASTTLTGVVDLLGAVARGQPAMRETERRELTAEWHSLRAQQEDLAARVASMSPRETQVLEFLHAGTPVREIAEALDVSEATVRSQVKRVLRKLDVRSQLAAVAAFESTQCT